ncbi:beta-ketoacyl synthase N-terminal-like domain-containing protein [Vibrio mangrovi]|uniref:Beta-ketoacyl synthase N-terminal-like domain-containing protein n=1 Tax=Vibrio mangrovi TaxID=474394 RepID=A0A1Y6ING1_9VIBR|nr:beta-ketoacyl synthase N-terminal-like domain-containing protein [Vibrio mangrovi]MDW6004024.1 beta-ketoacyl synthase N-terminal-like domain-containing protein [Vibrio mangrovi]SMR99178.1 Polyketide synthase PksM [Vibrio mangrovi]
MSSDKSTRSNKPSDQPDNRVAIISAGCFFPGQRHFEHLAEPQAWHQLMQNHYTTPWSETDAALSVAQVSDQDFDFRKFSIPPLFRKAVSKETRLALLAADDAFRQITIPESLRDHCDQYCAVHLGSDAAYRNATKVQALRNLAETLTSQGYSPQEIEQQVDAYKLQLAQTLGASSHDRIGEMASSIPARIAHFAQTRGKCQTIDGADLGGLRLLQLAQDSFRFQDSRIALLTSVQCFHHAEQANLLLAQGVSPNKIWLEGAISLLVCPVSVAQDNQWPILAELGDMSTQHASTQSESDCPYFSGANQIFSQVLEMLSQQKQHCSGYSFTGSGWQIGPMPTPRTVTYAQAPVQLLDYRPLTALGDDKAPFWQTLDQGSDTIQELSGQQLNQTALFRQNPQKLSTYIRKAMCFTSHDIRDVPPVKAMMPAKQHRLDVTQQYLLNACTRLSLTSAHMKSRQDEIHTAIIVASNLSLTPDRVRTVRHLWDELPQTLPLPRPQPVTVNRWSWYGASGIGSAMLIAQQLGIQADCYAVEAACASSMAALHDAVRGLQSGRYDQVIVAGIEMATTERDLVLCSAQMMLSTTRIRPFADENDGFTPGDGGGIFILSREPDSQEALATIRSISGSCDSRSMTAPDPEGQALAIEKTLALTDVKPGRIQYIEAHGTGTALGDVSEISAIRQHYQHKPDQKTADEKQQSHPLYIGSVKYNFGHCFAGAASLSLCKVLSAFEHEQIPPTPVPGNINPRLMLADLPADIPQETIPWPYPESGGRMAAINSFGTGGINYHLVIEQAGPATDGNK